MNVKQSKKPLNASPRENGGRGAHNGRINGRIAAEDRKEVKSDCASRQGRIASSTHGLEKEEESNGLHLQEEEPLETVLKVPPFDLHAEGITRILD